jgi:small GTP-binding protein
MLSDEGCKVVLLGETGVGKTSIIAQFMENEFSDDQPATTGATFVSKSLHIRHFNKLLNFEIWDTAGQEKFRSLSKMFYKDSAVVILVYDITNTKTFDELQYYWINQIKEHAPKKIIIAIAANKSDLAKREQVDEEQARLFARNIGAIFKITSAKNKSDIEDLFQEIGKCYYDPTFVYSNEALEEDKNLSQIRKASKKLQKEGTNDETQKTNDKSKNSKCC